MKRVFALLTALCLWALTTLAAQGEEASTLIWKTDGWSRLYISADGGASYAELPELGREAEKTGLAYYSSTMVDLLPDGGLRVRARDHWAEDFSFEREYTAAEVAAALEKAVPTPVRVLSADENGAFGVRVVDYNTGEGVAEGEDSWNQSVHQSVVTTDGVNWQVSDLDRGREGDMYIQTWRLGKYLFRATDRYWTKYGTQSGVLISSAEAPTQSGCCLLGGGGIGGVHGSIAAWYTPGDTVTVALYDQYDQFAHQGHFVQETFPLADLDAQLAQLQPRFEDVAAGDWFAPGVAVCVNDGLMIGVGDSRFAPDKTLTAPECLTLALRLNGLRERWDMWFPWEAPEDWGAEYGDAWWRGSLYTMGRLRDSEGVDWPGMEALCADTPEEKPVTRLTFAKALAEVTGDLAAVRTMDALPDLPRTPENEGIYTLYEAGVLTGVDDTGAFAPEATLTRAQAAAMLARVLDPALRADG